MYNILLVGNFGRGWDGSICDEEHIAKALESFGHKVTRIQREKTHEAEWKYLRADFALIAQWDNYFDDLIPRLRFFTDKIIYWAFDLQDQNQVWHQKLIEGSDIYLSKRIADSKYPNWQWFSQDFSPEFLHARNEPIEKDIDILFTGSYLPWAEERNKTIVAVNAMFDLQIYSVNDWPKEWSLNVHPPVMDEGLMDLIPRAKICLAIDHTLEAGYWSDRAAQYICCGGFVLHRYVPMIESRFHHNVMYFHGVEDCLWQIGNWLEPAEDREVVAAEGYENNPYYKVRTKIAELLEIIREKL